MIIRKVINNTFTYYLSTSIETNNAQLVKKGIYFHKHFYSMLFDFIYILLKMYFRGETLIKHT